MDIFKILDKELCEPKLKSRKKKSVIQEIAGILKRHPALNRVEEDEIVRRLLEREELGSTGFGGGLAIPHCRLPGLDQFVIGLGVSSRGVHFQAVDKHRVNLFCFMVGPENKPEQHVKLLAEVSLILRDESVKRELIKASSQTALYELFLRHCAGEKPLGKIRECKLLMLVLQDEIILEEVIELFVELGIRGASVIESDGMGKILSNVPLFADFINFLGQKRAYHRTIFALIPADDIDDIISRIENITGDMDKYAGSMALVMDIGFVKGSLEAI